MAEWGPTLYGKTLVCTKIDAYSTYDDMECLQCIVPWTSQHLIFDWAIDCGGSKTHVYHEVYVSHKAYVWYKAYICNKVYVCQLPLSICLP